jgi:transcriptional regulator with XRE-family HTH domain
MMIRTPADLGALIRNTRKKLRLHQSNLAKKIGLVVFGSSRSKKESLAPKLAWFYGLSILFG